MLNSLGLVVSWALQVAGCSVQANDPSPGPQSGLAPEGAAAADSSDRCGRPPLPRCPMQQWMQANLAQPFTHAKLDRLVKPFGALASLQLGGYPDWERIARRGATSAARGDAAEVRAACGACHDAYRARYHLEMRNRPLASSLSDVE